MDVRPLNTGAELLALCDAFLLEREVEEGLILGLAAAARTDQIQAWAVLSDAGVELVAMRTPPRKLIISHGGAAAIELLAEHLREHQVELPGVHGWRPSARAFARTYAGSGPRRVGMRMRLHSCDRVSEVPVPPGTPRVATADETATLLAWGEGFASEINIGDIDGAQMIRSYIDGERLWLWDHEGARSMCGWSRPTKHGVAVNAVYTPAAERGHGYATALVAAMTRQLLADGRAFTCLYTDLANATSNAIYARIGYVGVEDFEDWWFDGEPSATLPAVSEDSS